MNSLNHVVWAGQVYTHVIFVQRKGKKVPNFLWAPPPPQCFGIGGHEDTYIYDIMCFEIGLLLVLLATKMILITTNEDKMS